ncbi:flavoprotein [Verrucomicrobiota bacterium sgz303538]
MSAPVVVVGVTGSIAAYKAADLVSKGVKRGWDVHVVMTHGAQEFVTPLTFQTLSRNPVLTSVHDSTLDWKPGHISLADRANLLLVAPATANIIAEFANGLAANPLAEIALATLAPVLIAPAMNGKMWLHAATQHNVGILRSRGVHFVGPSEGLLACGYEGVGRMSEVEEILVRASELLGQSPAN